MIIEIAELDKYLALGPHFLIYCNGVNIPVNNSMNSPYKGINILESPGVHRSRSLYPSKTPFI